MCRRIVLLPLLVLVLTTAGCQIRQELSLEKEGGSARFEVEMREFFLRFLSEFFDIDASIRDLSTLLASREGVSSVEVSRPEPTRIAGRFRFTDPALLLGSSREARRSGIITLTGTTTRTLEFRLNRENYKELSALVPLLKDPYFATFGPEGSGDLTREEYAEMIAWTFEDMESAPGEAAAAFNNSTLTLRITVPGEIISHKGGRRVGTRELEIKIPLVDLLILDKELYYAVEYR